MTTRIRVSGTHRLAERIFVQLELIPVILAARGGFIVLSAQKPAAVRAPEPPPTPAPC
jgi:hypothetical protein